MTPNPELIGGYYRLVQKNGEGSYGEVLLVVDERLKKERVIKRIKPNLTESRLVNERFMREALAMAKIEHPNIVTIHSVEVDTDGRPFMVMQLVRGLSVQDLLVKLGALSSYESLRIIAEALKGLAEAHANGIVHRDIKPGNILVDGRSRRVLVTDFGIARDIGQNPMTQVGVPMGTEGFWAPEQRRNSGATADARSDIYALGATLYSMLSAKLPSNDFYMDVDAHAEETFAGIDLEIVAIIKRAVKYLPDERYQSADEMREEVEKVMAQLPRPEPIPFPDIPWLKGLPTASGGPISNPTAIPAGVDPEISALRGTNLPPPPRPIMRYVVGVVVVAIVGVGGWLAFTREQPNVVISEPVVEHTAETLTTGAAATPPEPTIEPQPAIKAEPVVVTKPMATTLTKTDKPKSKSPTATVTKPTKPIEAETAVEVQKPVTPSVGTPTSTMANGRLKIDVAVSGMTDAVVTARYRAEPGTNWLQKSMSPQGDIYRVEIAMTGELASGVAFFIEASGPEGKKRSGSAVTPFVVRPQ